MLEVLDVESTGGRPSDKWQRVGVCVDVVLTRLPDESTREGLRETLETEGKERHVAPVGKEEREVGGEVSGGFAEFPHCRANCLLDPGGVCQCVLFTSTGVASLSKCDTIISQWPEGAFSH